jgi:uncharacterized protein with ParB-like and HNH nuclease domain
MAVVKKIDGKATTVGEILIGENQYRVPTYQRDFAWTTDDVETLWDDITSSIKNNSKEYFIGAIVTSRTDDPKKWDIVDGQQRLTALSMVFAAVANAWSLRNDAAREAIVKKKIIGDVDMRTLEPTPRLTLNANNDQFYQLCVIKGEYKRDKKDLLIASNELIYQGYEKIKYLLGKWLEEEPKNVEDNLIALTYFISDNIYSIFIETGDESDAYITFETLNGRGVDLATSDLVKNLLFSKAAGKIEKFKQNWSEITLIVGGNDLTQFIRYFWIAYYSPVREKDLYKDIRNTIRNSTNALNIIEKLRKVATYYDALSNPNNVYWTDFVANGSDYKVHLDALALFKVTQYKPVVLAAMDVMSTKDLTRLLKVMSVISFRYTVVSGQNTGNLDRAYSPAAIAITNTPGIRPKAVFEMLKSVYVDDARFLADFEQKLFNREPIARYVLTTINNSEAESGQFVTDKTTVEHILPKNPSAEWNKFLGDNKVEDLVYLIGNLTLLDSSKNRDIGSKSFEIKKEKAFKLSNLPLNKSIKQCLHWSSKEIYDRSAELALKASTIWRIDY